MSTEGSGVPATKNAGPHVLTLTAFYPSGGDDAGGCFVPNRLQLALEIGRSQHRVCRATALPEKESSHRFFRFCSLDSLPGIARRFRTAHCGGLFVRQNCRKRTRDASP